MSNPNIYNQSSLLFTEANATLSSSLTIVGPVPTGHVYVVDTIMLVNTTAAAVTFTAKNNSVSYLQSASLGGLTTQQVSGPIVLNENQNLIASASNVTAQIHVSYRDMS